jgi:hypothetical protein
MENVNTKRKFFLFFLKIVAPQRDDGKKEQNKIFTKKDLTH